MPTFRWKGRSADGQALDGELDAPSKEEVIVRLRQQRITVSSITELGSSSEPRDPERRHHRHRAAPPRPQRVRMLLLVIGCVLVATAISYFAPLTTYRCDRGAAGRVDCTVSEHLLGIYPLRSQTLADVTSVETSSKSADQARIVFATRSGQSIRAAAWNESIATDGIRGELWSFVSSGTEPNIARRQIPRVPLILTAVLLIFASTVLAGIILSSFASVQEWVAAWVETKRR